MTAEMRAVDVFLCGGGRLKKFCGALCLLFSTRTSRATVCVKGSSLKLWWPPSGAAAWAGFRQGHQPVLRSGKRAHATAANGRGEVHVGSWGRFPGASRGGDPWIVLGDQARRLRAAAEAGQSLRGDSVAVCLAFERRRAASFRLLRLVRCFAAICSPSRHHHGEFHRTSCATCVAALPVPFQ